MRTGFLALLTLCLAAGPALAADDLEAVNVYPNPARVHAGDTSVTFDNLTRQATIRIFDADGRLVREVDRDDPSFQFLWPLANDNGEPVASGVYLYRITNPAGQKKIGKLAVIR